jgi:hypothetical protein
MNKWCHEVRSWSQQDIQEAVKDKKWQKFRLSLKGCATSVKLERLEGYLLTTKADRWQFKCRVDNYINALKRGGQLTVNGEVQR